MGRVIWWGRRVSSVGEGIIWRCRASCGSGVYHLVGRVSSGGVSCGSGVSSGEVGYHVDQECII
jgi:hypothetical protein